MCDECRKTPCDFRCPNAEASVACACDKCHGEIYVGDDAYRVGDKIFCEDCVIPFVAEADD
jgi:hypothetical protein